MKKLFLLLFALLPMVLTAQRHSQGIGAFEVFGAYTPASYSGWTAGVGYSNYLTTSSIFRLSAEYAQYDRKLYDKSFEIRNYTLGLEYLRTIVSNHNNLYLNIGAGTKGGYEDIGKAKDYLNEGGKESSLKSKFLAVPFVIGEVEFFPFPKTAVLLQVKEDYSPMSDLRKWNTSIGIGIRQLIF